MKFGIYTYGGGEILWKVYNGIAMLFAADNPFLTSAWKVSLAFGIIWSMNASIFNNRFSLFGRDYVLPSFLLMNILFLPKTEIHIVDKVDQHFKYAKVDHVPFGLAAIPSLISSLCMGLTENTERVLAPVDANKYTETGMMFGARLVSQASELRIVDPIQRENLKGFLNRCWLWPYVYTNCKGLKNEAKTTPDILGFLEAHPHSWLGTFWKKADGTQEFRSCRECLPEVRAMVAAEAKGGLGRLAKSIFPWDATKDPDGTINSARLGVHFNDAWITLAGEVSSAQETIQQYILMNAARETYDDEREQGGLHRLYPHLVGMQGARVQAEQNMMGLIRGDVAGSWIPTLQVIFLSLLIAAFPFVVVMTFLPGGFKNLKMWTQLIVWVQTWPIFYAILNSIGLMFLARATQIDYVNFGGLNLLSQYAIQDQAYNAYSYIQGFMLTIPMLSWAMVSASGYALSGLASAASSMLDSATMRAASETVEGNAAFGNMSLYNRSVATQSMGQSTMGNNFNFGSSLDTGSMRLMSDQAYGHMHVENRQSSLGFEVAATQAYAQSLAHQVSQSRLAVQSAEKGFNDNLSVYDERTAHIAEAIAQGQAFDSSVSHDRRLEQQHSMEKVRDAMDRIAQDKSSTDLGQVSVSGSLGIGAKIWGSLGGEMGVEGLTTAQNSEAINKLKEYGISERDLKNVSDALQSARSDSFRAHSDRTKTLTDDYRSAYNQTKAAHESLSVARSQEMRDQQTYDYVRNNETRLSLPLGDHLLHKVADDRFSGDTLRAAEWIKENISTASAWSAPYLHDFRPGDVHHANVIAQYDSWGRRVDAQQANLTQQRSQGLYEVSTQNTDLRTAVQEGISNGKASVDDAFDFQVAKNESVEQSSRSRLERRDIELDVSHTDRVEENKLLRALKGVVEK